MRGEESRRSGRVAHRVAPTVVVAVSIWTLLAACSTPSVGAAELPSRPPDLQATVAGEPGAAYIIGASATGEGAWRDVSGGYFERMLLSGWSVQDTVVVGSDDRALTSADLAAGDVIDVWIGDVCAESSPVQCEVVAIRIAA